ncbi:DUF1822 family protein [Sphaerospermopsis torques-reginae]|uniref:DUF1822 family protein n=1 Tax=Sphaerospermopsis torques-reginae ITEP-024 TaxID=984208 RepID=A0ABX8WVU2_9CYAN|nr:DUF1822 family protein [Sphaerospermopsis torques-reginae]QYX30519.1 DUF1822 family protein [Sphaerospermopsis torques-reginae ITEP-024]
MNSELFAQLIPIPENIRQAVSKFKSINKAIDSRSLAVWVVHRYLKRFDYDSDLHSSSAWNPVLQLLTELADLEIFEGEKSLGIVECIPIATDADTLEIPEQAVTGEYIAYIAVEINPEHTWGKVVGFTPALETEYPEVSIDRDDLLPAHKLLDLLEKAENLTDESLSAELREYLGELFFNEQHQAIVAQLERALLLETSEPLQIETAAQEIEALMAQSVPAAEEELVLTREDTENSDRGKLRDILKRLFQSLGKE